MKKRYRRTAVSQYLIIALALIIVTFLGFYSTKVMSRVPFKDDFVIPWTMGRSWLLEGVNPYDPVVVENAENTVSKSDYLAEVPVSATLKQPLINLIFYLPFSLIPYEISRAIWIIIITLCIGVICYLSISLSGWQVSTIEKVGIILLFSFWLPGAYSILSGKITPIVILLILLGIFLILKEQDSTAGFILSLTMGSLPISLIILISILIWSISRRRWSILIAYFSGGAFLFIVSLLLLPTWPLDWLHILVNTVENGDWIQTPLMLPASLLPGIENFLMIFLHSIFLLYLIILWITIRKKTGRVFIWKTFMLLLLSVLLTLQLTISGLYFVLPAAFLVFRFWYDRWKWVGKLLSWAIIIIIVVGPWIYQLPEANFVDEIDSPIILVGLPMLFFIAMIWIRWWALEIPRVADQYS
ncbi:MAG: glycosyltransferase 87 family protein [Chloroflexota bacterium]|nr:glycosyltransferase 87 family protein [Chloroflexota bacterium]